MSDRKRVEELTLKVLDDEASDAEIEELERIVSSDDLAKEAHIALVEQEAVLRGAREGVNLTDAILARVRRALGESVEKGVMERIRARPRPERAAREGGAPVAIRPIEPEWRWLGSARFWLVSAAAAAVFLLAVGLHAWHVSSRHATPQEAFLYGQGELVPGVPTAYRAFVRNAMTSEPVPEARVSFALLDPGGATVWKTGGTTDANGIVEILPLLPDDAPEGDYTLKADVSSTAGESTISRGVAVERSFRALVTTDKPLYQPGQTIHIRTLALAKADLRPVARRGIVLEVRDAKGNKVFKKVTETSEFGIASADFVLADQVNMGEYTVSATVGDTTSERSVTVKRYRLPKFKVSLSTDKGYYAPGETVVCDLAADYTFGKPVAGGRVQVVASEYIEKLRPFAGASGFTDAEGRLRVEIPLKRSFVGQELRKGDAFVTLEATVTDAADHTQKKTLDFTVTTDPIRIEVFPESGQLVQNVENVLYVVTAYPDGRPAKTRLYFRKIDEWAETSDVGVAKIKITPTEPHLQLTIFAEGSHGVRAEATRELRVDARADTVLLRTDRAVYKAGGTAVVSVLSPGGRGRVFLDVVKDRRTVLMKSIDLKGVRGVIALDLPADLFGTLELHAYRIMRDGNIVGDAKVIQVTRADDLTITASLDKEVYRPAEKAILDLVVRRAGREGKGEPVRTALGLSGVDEAVFALQEMRPGLERVYFMLQEEILKPRYEICAHPPFSARRAIRRGPPERPELEEASVVLFSSAEGSAPPARDASETFQQKNERFDWDKQRYYAGLWGAAAMLPVLLFFASVLPLIAYAVSRLFRREPIEGADERDTRALGHAARWMAVWWSLGFYLPVAIPILLGLLLAPFRHDHFLAPVLIAGLIAAGAVYFALTFYARQPGGRWQHVAAYFYTALVAGGIIMLVLVHGRRGFGWNWQWLALLAGAGAAVLAFVKIAIWTRRLRRNPASHAAPIMRKLAAPIPIAYFLAWGGVFALIAAADPWPRCLSPATAVLCMILMGVVAVALVGAISAAVTSVLRRLTRGELWVVALTRSLAAAAPALAVILLVAPLMFGGMGMKRMEVMGPMDQMADVGAASEGSEEEGGPMLFRRQSVLRKMGLALPRPSRKAADPEGAGTRTLKAPTRIRRYFPETLLWKPELITDERGRARLEVPLADSITTWRIAMSAVSARGELGSGTKGLRVFQDFFVDIDFPVALTQHDRVSVPVAVYNYLDRPQTVRLEIEPRAWFRLEGDRSRELRIGAKEVTSVYLTMEALRPGSHSLLVKAYGTEMADAVERRVRVEPDGEPFVRTINGRLGENLTREFTIPEGAIDGASDLIVKIYPGSFSQVLEGLDSIFRMPFGCFEQTSSVTYPNILVLDYMRRTKQIKPEIEMKALNFINLGYQRLLSFEVTGGGFDWYGKAPANTVLTAYGLMEFSDMAEVYEIDPAVISRTREWLRSKQERDGSWAPTHMRAVRNARHAKQARLRTTAYVAWAMAESVAEGRAPSKVRLARALDYVAGGIEGESDPYTLAVAANALIAAGRSDAKRVLGKLDGLKKVEGKLIRWSSQGQGVTYSRGNVLDVETTALAAYAYLKASHRTGDAHKALAWLVEKKDPRGTWWSTQATVHAMRALLTGSGPSGAAEGELDVTISANGKLAKELVITPETSDVFRLVSLRALVREGPNDVSLEVAGKGELAYQIVATHYMPWAREAAEGGPARKEITIDVKYDTTRLRKDDTLTSRVTIRYNRPEPANMTIIDLGIPPGFEVIPDLFEALKKNGLIERYSMTGRQVTLYMRELRAGEPFSFEYKMRAKFPVRVKTPRSKVYQYYEPAVRDETVPVEIVVL